VILDTNILVDLFVECQHKRKNPHYCSELKRYIRNNIGQVRVSEFTTRIELPRAIVNSIVRGIVPINNIEDVWKYIEELVKMSEHYYIEPLTRDDLTIAKEMYDGYKGRPRKIRTQDAIILAVAINRGASLLTADRELVDALSCRHDRLNGYDKLKVCTCQIDLMGKRHYNVNIILAQP